MHLCVTESLKQGAALCLVEKARAIAVICKNIALVKENLAQRQRDRVAAQEEAVAATPPIIQVYDSDDSEEDAPSTRAKAKPLRTLLDCPTRWSSCWRMLSRLVQLKDDIRIVLQLGGYSEDDLSDTEWIDLSILCRILAPFSNAVRVWEGEKYSTLSLVWPLSQSLADFLSSPAPNPDDKAFPTWQEIEKKYPASHAERLKLRTEIARPDRFGDLSDVMKIATMLDPRMKDLSFLAKSKRTKAFDTLLNEIDQDAQPIEATASSSDMATAVLFPFKEAAKKTAVEEPDVASELQRYRSHPVAGAKLNDLNILSWWRTHSPLFPALAALARTYLALPASSAPSERVFSKMNVVVDKRRAFLHYARAERLVFLKHNKFFF